MNFFLIHNLYYVLNNYGENDNFHQRFKYYLSITMVFSLIILIYASTDLFNQVDIGFMGVCGIAKDSSIQFASLVFLALIFPFCIYVFVNSFKHYKELVLNIKEKKEGYSMESSKISFENENQRIYLFLNMSYMLLFVVDWLPLAILNFMSWSCTFYISCDYHTEFSEVWETMCLLLISGNGLFIFLIRIREPTLRKFYLKVCMRRKSKSHKKFSLKSQLIDKALVKSRLNEPLMTEPEPVLEQNISLQPEKITEDKNLTYLQIFFLLRIILLKQIGGKDVRFYSSCESPFGETTKNSKLEEVSQSGFNQVPLNGEEKIPWADHWYTKFDVEMYDINKLLEEVDDDNEKNLISSKEKEETQIVTSITYCRKLFEWLRNNKVKTDLKTMHDSLDLIKNQGVVLKNTEQNLTHHEFTTFDSRLVVAVISKEVKRFLLDGFLKDYHEHLYTKPLSFLPNYLGLFSFQFQQASSNKSYSILIYENPYSEFNFFKMKELFDNPSKEILAVYYVQAEKTKKKTLYQCEDKMFKIEKSDLKLKSEDKSVLLNFLYDDLTFLTNMGAFNYRLCLVFFKFDDKMLIESTFHGFNNDETTKTRKDKSILFNNRFNLENRIGYCIGTIRNMFKFIEKRKKKGKEKLKFDGAINKEVSIYNPMNYGRFLYEQAQDL